MEATPIIPLPAVRQPVAVRDDAFFYYERNRDYLNGRQNVGVQLQNTFDSHDDITLFVIGGVAVVSVVLLIALAFLRDLFLFVLFQLLFGALFLPRLWEGWRTRKSIRRLDGDGQIVSGELVNTIASIGGTAHKALFYVEASYRFTSPSGTLVEGRVKHPCPDLSGVALPVPGTPVYVLYFGENDFYLL